MIFDPLDLRQKIARVAAYLLYFGIEKEYRQAKLKAAKTYGATFLPSNLEIALQFEELTEETEGQARKTQIIEMRLEALRVMELLEQFSPLLIGSVWRGTIHRSSDIDIIVYHDSTEEILSVLKANKFQISKTERIMSNKSGKLESYFHIHTSSLKKQDIEIVIHETEKKNEKRKCELFGDEITGLTIQGLKELIEENPFRKFIPT